MADGRIVDTWGGGGECGKEARDGSLRARVSFCVLIWVLLTQARSVREAPGARRVRCLPFLRVPYI